MHGVVWELLSALTLLRLLLRLEYDSARQCKFLKEGDTHIGGFCRDDGG